jgi:hypothetical protein
LAKCDLIWIDDSQVVESEVAHGARSSAYVERIARPHQDDTQMIKF